MGKNEDQSVSNEPSPTPPGESAATAPRFNFLQFRLPDITKVPPARIIALLVLLGVLIYLQVPSGPPSFEQSGDGVRRELVAVIESQLAAFRTNDWPTAHTFAAAPIRQRSSVSAFELMVRQGYPAIANSTAAKFGMATDNGREAVILVFVQGRDGLVVHYQYFLIRENGQWKINGVNLGRPGAPAGGGGQVG